MSRASLAALLLLLGACSRTAAPSDTAPAGQAAPIALTSQTIALPDETATLPASAEILTTNCTACHSPYIDAMTCFTRGSRDLA